MINLDMAAEDSEWPPGSAPFAYLDVPVTSAQEAAYLFLADEEGLFRAMETAHQGDLDRWDGKLSTDDWQAVLDDPGAFDHRAVAIARFFRNNPDEWLAIDTARDGAALQHLAEGRYGLGDGDGIGSFADVQQYLTNRQLFDTLVDELDRTDSVLVDLDGDGRFDEDEFGAALERLEASHPDYQGLTQAVEHVLEADLLALPDDRAWYEQVGDGLYRISSLVPGSPTHVRPDADRPPGPGGRSAVVRHRGRQGGAGHRPVRLRPDGGEPRGPGLLDRALAGRWRSRGAPGHPAGAGHAAPGRRRLSLVPGTPQHRDALAEVRRQGTWDVHPGLNLGLAAVDWEGFVDDPAEWAGQFAPDVLLSVLTGGGGAISRIGTTGARVASSIRRLVVGVSANGLRFSLRNGLRAGLTRAAALGVRWRDDVVRTGGHIRHQSLVEGRLLPRSPGQLWRSRPERGVLGDANFAQTAIRSDRRFSRDGIELYSRLAGRPVETVDDLAAAIRAGAVRVDQLPVDYVVIDGQKLILNTRTSTALRLADVPQVGLVRP